MSYQRFINRYSYSVLNDLVFFDIFIALLAIIKMNQHVCEVVIELDAFSLLELLHLLDLLLLLNGHVRHLIVHGWLLMSLLLS